MKTRATQRLQPSERQNWRAGTSLSRRALSQHGLADAAGRHDQLGRRLHRPRPVSHLQQCVRFALAAGSGQSAGSGLPAHRGTALSLLRLLARAGAHPRDAVLRTDSPWARCADQQRLERNPVPGLCQTAAAHHLSGCTWAPSAPQLRVDFHDSGRVLPRHAGHPPRATRIPRSVMGTGGNWSDPRAGRAGRRAGLPLGLDGHRGHDKKEWTGQRAVENSSREGPRSRTRAGNRMSTDDAVQNVRA